MLLASQHHIKLTPLSTSEQIWTLLVLHLSKGHCVRGISSDQVSPGCSVVIDDYQWTNVQEQNSNIGCDDLQIHVLSSLVKKIACGPLIHILQLHSVAFLDQDSLRKICKDLWKYITRLKKGKSSEKHQNQDHEQDTARHAEFLQKKADTSS